MAPFTTSSSPDGATSRAAFRAGRAGTGTPGGSVTGGSRPGRPSDGEVGRPGPPRTEHPRGVRLPSDDKWLGGGRW